MFWRSPQMRQAAFVSNCKAILVALAVQALETAYLRCMLQWFLSVLSFLPNAVCYLIDITFEKYPWWQSHILLSYRVSTRHKPNLSIPHTKNRRKQVFKAAHFLSEGDKFLNSFGTFLFQERKVQESLLQRTFRTTCSSCWNARI